LYNVSKSGIAPRLSWLICGSLVVFAATLALLGGMVYGSGLAQAGTPTATAYVNSPTGLNQRASITTMAGTVGKPLAHNTKVILTCRSLNGQSVRHGNKASSVWGGTLAKTYLTAAYLRMSTVNAIRLRRLPACKPPHVTGGAPAGDAGTPQGGAPAG
jgi:hypothetical protein